MSENSQFDVVIIGIGPAGLQAAIHAARKKASVLLLGKPQKAVCSGPNAASLR